MVFLGIPPLTRRHNLCRNRLLEPLLADLIGDILGLLLLLLAMREDHAPVLSTNVRTLPVQSGSVVHAVEELEELAVCHERRVKADLESFGVCTTKQKKSEHRRLVHLEHATPNIAGSRADLRPVLPLHTDLYEGDEVWPPQ